MGLVKYRNTSTLIAFIDGYIEQRSDFKESTQDAYSRVRKHLLDYFGEDLQLRDITSGDADAWRLNLLEKGLADNTVRRTCGVAKQWFTSTVRSRLIIENPFADLPAAMKGNSRRFYYIKGQEAEAVFSHNAKNFMAVTGTDPSVQRGRGASSSPQRHPRTSPGLEVIFALR